MSSFGSSINKSGKKLKPKGGGVRARPNASANAGTLSNQAAPLPTPPPTQITSTPAVTATHEDQSTEPPQKRRRLDEDRINIHATTSRPSESRNTTLSQELDVTPSQANVREESVGERSSQRRSVQPDANDGNKRINHNVAQLPSPPDQARNAVVEEQADDLAGASRQGGTEHPNQRPPSSREASRIQDTARADATSSSASTVEDNANGDTEDQTLHNENINGNIVDTRTTSDPNHTSTLGPTMSKQSAGDGTVPRDLSERSNDAARLEENETADITAPIDREAQEEGRRSHPVASVEHEGLTEQSIQSDSIDRRGTSVQASQGTSPSGPKSKQVRRKGVIRNERLSSVDDPQHRGREHDSPMFEAEETQAPQRTQRKSTRKSRNSRAQGEADIGRRAKTRRRTRQANAARTASHENESDPEKHEHDPAIVTLTDLTRDSGKGVMGRIEKRMLDINWDEVKKKRQEAEEREFEEAERERREQEIDARLERAGEQAGESQHAPRTKIVNGEIVVDQDSLTVDRHAAATAQAENAVVDENEEDDITKKVNQHSHIHDNRRDPEERRIMKMKSDPWSEEETEHFFTALGMFGTDFYIISTMFPGKTRRQIKLKFIREERKNAAHINQILLGINGKGKEMDLAKYAEFTGREESYYKNPEQIEQELAEARQRQQEDLERQKQEAVDAQRDKQRKAAEKQEAAKKERAAKRAARKQKTRASDNAAAYHDGVEEIVEPGEG